VSLRVASELRRAGVPLQSLRKVIDYVRSRGFDRPLGGAFLVASGEEVYLRDGDDLIATLREPGQKILFQVVNLERTVEELKSEVIHLKGAEDAEDETREGRAAV